MDHIWVNPHSKHWTLDFCVFSAVFLSPRSFFHTRQRFPIQKHVTSGLGDVTSGSGPITSGSGDVTSGHVTSGSGHVATIFMVCGFRCYAQPLNPSQTRPGGVYANYRGKFCYLGPHYYCGVRLSLRNVDHYVN